MRAAADARHRLDQEHVPPAVLQPPCRGDSRGARTDDQNLGVHSAPHI